MDIFPILQILFDAVLLFGILFLFHFSVHQSRKKKEEADILKNMQVQEIKENLQELLMTLKQLGKEVSDNIQEQVKEAEEKTDYFKKIIQKLQKDLNKTALLAEEITGEKKHLEEKIKVIQTAKKITPKILQPIHETSLSGNKELQ
jgi:septal ring factor EnvC (AmiA/AmiB activator)